MEKEGDKMRKQGAPIPNTGKKFEESKDARRDAEIADTAERAFKGKRKGKGRPKRGSNPESWYNKHPQEVKDAGSISYGTPTGGIMRVDSVEGYSNYTGLDIRMPGVVSIEWIPAVGVSHDKTSPINRGAYTAYVELRSKLKLANTYDSQDMMIALVAVDSALAFHEMGRRVYGSARIPAPPENKYYPRTLLQALGFDPDDILQHLADFRNYLNVFASQMYAYAMPQGMTFSDRHQWMSQNVYLDADNLKAQTFVFKMAGFWAYDNTVTTGSQLNFQSFGGTGTAGLLTYADYVRYGEQIINTLLGDDDIGDIMGDLKNAFGDSAFRHFATTEENFTIVPVYNEEVLEQITNAKFCGSARAATMNIRQNPSVNEGAIIFEPQFYDGLEGNPNVQDNAHFCHAPLLNAHLGTEPIDNIEKTRLTAVMGKAAGTEPWNGADNVAYCDLLYCGTEICTYFQIYRKPFTGDLSNLALKLTNSLVYTTTDQWSAIITVLADILWLQSFDWCWEFEKIGRAHV